MAENELSKDSVVKYYLTTASDSKDFNTRRKMLEAEEADAEDLTLFDDLDSLIDTVPLR